VIQYRAPSQVHWLVTVDTGKRKAGLALWRVTGDDAQLLDAELVVVKGRWAAARMAVALLATAQGLIEGRAAAEAPVIWMVEKPRKLKNMQAAHKDLDALLAVLEDLAPRVKAATGRVPKPVWPSKWKGQVPKAAHHPRITRELRPGEPTSEQKDVLDAIGIGLWATGRTGRGGVR
jgi:hypothetical protein